MSRPGGVHTKLIGFLLAPKTVALNVGHRFPHSHCHLKFTSKVLPPMELLVVWEPVLTWGEISLDIKDIWAGYPPGIRA